MTATGDEAEVEARDETADDDGVTAAEAAGDEGGEAVGSNDKTAGEAAGGSTGDGDRAAGEAAGGRTSDDDRAADIAATATATGPRAEPRVAGRTSQ